METKNILITAGITAAALILLFLAIDLYRSGQPLPEEYLAEVEEEPKPVFISQQEAENIVRAFLDDSLTLSQSYTILESEISAGHWIIKISYTLEEGSGEIYAHLNAETGKVLYFEDTETGEKIEAYLI